MTLLKGLWCLITGHKYYVSAGGKGESSSVMARCSSCGHSLYIAPTPK